MNKVMYHGSEEHDSDGDVKFFSDSFDFSSDYGLVEKYRIVLDNVFDICDRSDCERLLKVVGVLEDPYDGFKYRSYDELEKTGLIGMDTWELSENYSGEIKRLGYDGIVLYEGGTYNVMVLFSDTYERIYETGDESV